MLVSKYTGSNTFKNSAEQDSHPQGDQVKIKVAYCGICGTDMHIFHGKMDKRVSIPQVIGHEMSGVVEETGPDVNGFKPGEHVTVRPLDYCGECKTCKAGHTHICENLKFMGIDTPGAMQEFWTVPEKTLHKLPEDLPLNTAALTEPLAVACHDVRRGRVTDGDYAVVLGGGPIGLLVAMAAREAGAKVIISEINEYRLGLAKKMGFKTINPKDADLVKHVTEATSGSGADVVFEVTASHAGAEVMTELARPRGRIVLVGIFSQPEPVDLFKFFWKELELIGARVYEKEDFETAISLAASGRLPLKEILTDAYELQNIQKAFESFDGNPKAMKVLVKTS